MTHTTPPPQRRRHSTSLHGGYPNNPEAGCLCASAGGKVLDPSSPKRRQTADPRGGFLLSLGGGGQLGLAPSGGTGDAVG